MIINKSTKVQAFTLIEIMIVLLLSVTIAFFAYKILAVAMAEFNTYRKKQDAILSIVLFNKRFDDDMDKCRYVFFNAEKRKIMFTGNDTIIYSLGTNVVRSRDNVQDTVRIVLGQVSPVLYTPFASVGLVHALKLNITAPLEINEITFRKKYASADLMELVGN